MISVIDVVEIIFGKNDGIGHSENINDLATCETSYVHTLSLNKKTKYYSSDEMCHKVKSALFISLKGSQRVYTILHLVGQ